MAKKDGPYRRLAKSIAERERWRARLAQIDVPPAPAYEWSDESLRDWLAELGEVQSVRDAFEAVGLDPGNPFDWEELITDLCEAHFGKRRKRRQIWDDNRLARLAADFRKVQAENPGKTDEDIRKLLVTGKKFRDRYSKNKSHALDCESIRRLMPTARKKLAAIVAKWKANDIVWTPPLDKKLADWAIEQWVIESLSTDLAGYERFVHRLVELTVEQRLLRETW